MHQLDTAEAVFAEHQEHIACNAIVIKMLNCSFSSGGISLCKHFRVSSFSSDVVKNIYKVLQSIDTFLKDGNHF